MKSNAERVAVRIAPRPCMRAVPGEIVAGARIVPKLTSSNSSVQAACELAGGGMTANEVGLPVAVGERVGRVDIAVGVDGVCFHFEGDFVAVCSTVTFVAFGDDVERRVEAEDVAVFIGAKRNVLLSLLDLSLNRLKRWFLTWVLQAQEGRCRYCCHGV
eukprot:6172727-Pleurochrysis_carterae.AAC.1